MQYEDAEEKKLKSKSQKENITSFSIQSLKEHLFSVTTQQDNLKN